MHPSTHSSQPVIVRISLLYNRPQPQRQRGRPRAQPHSERRPGCIRLPAHPHARAADCAVALPGPRRARPGARPFAPEQRRPRGRALPHQGSAQRRVWGWRGRRAGLERAAPPVGDGAAQRVRSRACVCSVVTYLNSWSPTHHHLSGHHNHNHNRQPPLQEAACDPGVRAGAAHGPPVPGQRGGGRRRLPRGHGRARPGSVSLCVYVRVLSCLVLSWCEGSRPEVVGT